MMLKRLYITVLWTSLSLGLLLTSPAMAKPDADKAKAFMQNIGGQTLSLLSENTPKSERITKLIPLLQDSLAMNLIGRATLGRNFKKLKGDNAKKFNANFGTWVALNVATKLGGISLKEFNILNTATGKKDVTVRTKVTSSDGVSVTADWRVRDFDGTLKIIDLKLDGISMIVTQRSEFASVVKNKGIDGFVDGLIENIDSIKKSLK